MYALFSLGGEQVYPYQPTIPKIKTMRYKMVAKRSRSVIIEDMDGNLYEAYPLKAD